MFQQTYATPLNDLSTFVHTLLDSFEANKGVVCIEQLVFNPRELIWYLKGLGIVTDESRLEHSTLEAEDTAEVVNILECLLGQWIDFAFFPSSKEFVSYADHDEYTTVFTPTVEILNLLRSKMQAQSFKEIENWTWSRPRSQSNTKGTDTDV
ncbi:hypothetical protein GCM10011585_18920 [Edaphobacter dinghuensis]|uniref:Uncharacterized protein n=2 Tax=Edaphobacter dinghuensis TaxID=1560005 RepID=A0A917HEG2_9BACT|nr:hypothetical protein GCM10011585_18920 [Edaphobacter dinghuensis]